jgi:cyclophilin family peptidyl-prolyl cis-trans isomerase
MTRHILPVLVVSVVFLAGAVLAQAPSANPKVLLKTSKGDITMELYPAKAPITVQNILDYVEAKFYDGLIFHRVIPNFMIQCGGLDADMRQKTGSGAIKNEAGNGLKNGRGSVAMARTDVVDSATSQFFINLKDNAFLNHKDDTPQGFGYCVFGKVVAGMDVVDAIAKVATANKRGHGDVPVEPVTILSATVVK